MSFAPDSRRPRAGQRHARLALVLALCAMLGLPLATAGHHHPERTAAGGAPEGHDHEGSPVPGDGPDCSICLWQAHHAADLVPPVGEPGTGVDRLVDAATAPRALAIAPAAPLARAPPRPQA